MTLSKMDYWRFSHEHSVVDTAILITGNDPSSTYRDDDYNEIQNTHYDGFDAVFKALRSAILSNKLRANIQFSARMSEIKFEALSSLKNDDFETSNEQGFTYSMLLSRDSNLGTIKSNFELYEFLKDGECIYVSKEPNWRKSTIDVSELKEWLSSIGMYPEFFFPNAQQEGFRSQDNIRYAAKMATCVAAWEAVKKAAPNKSVKQTLSDWIRSNGVLFGIGENGTVSETKANELAAIATPAYDTTTDGTIPLPIENYTHRIDLENGPYSNDDLDDVTPF